MTIVQINVCDFCGNSAQINSGSFNGLSCEFNINRIESDKMKWPVFIKKTFCCHGCMIEYFKLNVNDKDGFVEKKEK